MVKVWSRDQLIDYLPPVLTFGTGSVEFSFQLIPILQFVVGIGEATLNHFPPHFVLDSSMLLSFFRQLLWPPNHKFSSSIQHFQLVYIGLVGSGQPEELNLLPLQRFPCTSAKCQLNAENCNASPSEGFPPCPNLIPSLLFTRHTFLATSPLLPRLCHIKELGAW